MLVRDVGHLGLRLCDCGLVDGIGCHHERIDRTQDFADGRLGGFPRLWWR